MHTLLMISNRLPKQASLESGNISFYNTRSGLASSLKQFYQEHNTHWIGWTGVYEDNVNLKEKDKIRIELQKNKCLPIYFDKETGDNYLHGFCNYTLWPLFHYFLQNTEFKKEYWEAYKKINELYAEEALKIISEDQMVWIHDFHLLLLPKLIRKKMPNIPIGIFMHIPFPSFELFRLLPWREEILEGMLGADLVGFHTFDYERHFLSSVRRLLGYETYLNQIRLPDRIVKVDNFPMGIDYEKFNKLAVKVTKGETLAKSDLRTELFDKISERKDFKVILSYDKLDYIKGISDRLLAFEQFLMNHPEYLEKVSMLLYVTPSRENVKSYQRIKKRLDELVGRINGEYGVINWVPIWYFYREISESEEIEILTKSDIGLITPLRDGMNLIAKKFIACKTNQKGVLILSEMAGSSKEMSEAMIVNPCNIEEISNAIYKALIMPVEEQKINLGILQNRLKLYNIEKWSNDYIDGLLGVKKLQDSELTRKLTDKHLNKILKEYNSSSKRIFFLDYDGTLRGFVKDPQKASPDEELYSILKKLTTNDKNMVIIISGRDKETLGKWFDEKWNITFVAEHGVWYRNPGEKWEMFEQINNDWMEIIRPVLEFYVARTPRTFIETKNYSLVWHYRDADPDHGNIRAWELKEELKVLGSNLNLEIMDGDKVIEIKYSGINKGRAASNVLSKSDYDFIIAMGDDWTDEYTFDALPETAHMVKVGKKTTKAQYYVEDDKEIRKLLKKLV